MNDFSFLAYLFDKNRIKKEEESADTDIGKQEAGKHSHQPHVLIDQDAVDMHESLESEDRKEDREKCQGKRENHFLIHSHLPQMSLFSHR